MRRKPYQMLLRGAFGAICLAGVAHAQNVQSIVDAEVRRLNQAQQQQDQIDAIVEQTRDAFDEYQRVLKEIYTLEVYNDVQQRLVDDQNRDLDQLRASIDQVSVIERQILPLMTRMIDGLEDFIELDAPFLLEDRRARVQFLNDLVDRSDVTVAEKFRNVMEAWQTENDYGAFNDTYLGTVQIDGAERQVEFLKIGRVALLFLTPDRQIAGRWNPLTRSWDYPLAEDLRDSILQGLEMVNSGSPADAQLFTIPIAPPEE
jgi:hypothetical protein